MDHRWNTREYESRTQSLGRSSLGQLYPSEAWSLYRAIGDSKSVLDLGCGMGSISSNCNTINSACKYTGVDFQKNVIDMARMKFPFAHFEAMSLLDYLETYDAKFDTVMSWSVLKSFQEWRDIIAGMLARSNKYVLFDLRVIMGGAELFNENVLYAQYGDRKGPILYLGFDVVCEYLSVIADELSLKIEVAGYESEWGKFVHFHEKKLAERTALISVFIEKLSPETNEATSNDLLINVPQFLKGAPDEG